jgi:ubiquinone/menaquinone biosynthesis C-methylase UbiE
MGERRFGGKLERLHSPERIQLLEIERVLDLSLEGIEASSVLDIGVGGGLFAKAFLERGLKVAGIDVNPDMVAAASEFAPQGEYKEAIAEELPYADQSFDLIFMGHVFHEVDDFVKTLEETRRVARQRIMILEWPYREQEVGPPMDHRMQEETVVGYAKDAGFTDIVTTQLTHLVMYQLNQPRSV